MPRARFFALPIILVIGYWLSVIGSPVLAQGVSIAPAGFAETIALPSTDLRTIVANIINVALGFLGMIAVVLVLYGGLLWMTSAGNDEKITKAKKVLINAAVGLVIILAAYSIAQFVFRLLGVRGEAVPSAAPAAGPIRVGGGALGSGIIENHYPARGQSNVPRNTKIIVTFKDAVDPRSLANTTAVNTDGAPKYFNEVGGNRQPVAGLTLKNDALQIIKTADIEGSTRESDLDKYASPVAVTFTSDLRTWVLEPPLLGSATENISFNIYLCGSKSPKKNCGDGIKLLSGAPAFGGRFTDYEWTFETGTFLDLTPPTIISIVPMFDNKKDAPDGTVADRRDKPRNGLIQVIFSEPVLPTVVSGKTVTAPMPPASGSGGSYQGGALTDGTYGIMRVSADSAQTFVAGEWQIGNQYKTVEFTPADPCGRNACGQTVYCLPGLADIRVQARSATLKSPPDRFISAGSLDGIEDLASNALDGNKNNTPDGAGTSYYDLNSSTGASDSPQWSFWTLASVDLTAPSIEKTVPGVTRDSATGGVAFQQPVDSTFSKPMSMTTLNSRNVLLSGEVNLTKEPWDTWWIVGGVNVDADNDQEPEKTVSEITHGGFWELSDFDTSANQEVKDLYQNCYFPGKGAVCSPGADPPCSAVCGATPSEPYCCNGLECAAGDSECRVCGF